MTKYTSIINKGFICLMVALFTLSFIQGQTITYDEVSSAAKKPKVDFTEYHASNGQVFKIGDKIRIGDPSKFNDKFQWITITDGFSYAELAPNNTKGWESEIKKFKMGGSKRMGFQVLAVGKTENGFGVYWIGIEKALEDGEIVSSIMTRSEAIAKLKEAKDLLDLEMMTQEEYDKLKKELEPIIRREQ